MSNALWGILSIALGGVVYRLLPNPFDNEAMTRIGYISYRNPIFKYGLYLSSILPPVLWLIGVILGFSSSWILGLVYIIFTIILWIVLSPPYGPSGLALTSPGKMEHIKMVLVGKHIFDNLLQEDQKNQVLSLANERLKEGTSRDRDINDFNPRVRYTFFALAMAELGIEHGLSRFEWSYIRNPFMLETYKGRLWRVTIDMVQRDFGLDVKL